MERPTVVERAYELAGSGDFGRLEDIFDRLRKEGYTDLEGQLSGWGYPGTASINCRRRVRQSEPPVSAGSEPVLHQSMWAQRGPLAEGREWPGDSSAAH